MPFPLPAVSQAVRPSVFGYPMRSPSESEMAFFERSGIPGYAAEDMAVVLNPNSRLSPDERAAVAQNEASRLWMRENQFQPRFTPSPEQRASFVGTPYEKNPNAMLETLLARLLSGDPSAGVPSQAMQVDADTVKRGLQSR